MWRLYDPPRNTRWTWGPNSASALRVSLTRLWALTEFAFVVALRLDVLEKLEEAFVRCHRYFSQAQGPIRRPRLHRRPNRETLAP